MVRKIVRPKRLPALRSSCRPRGTLGDEFQDCAVADVPVHDVGGEPPGVVCVQCDLQTILVGRRALRASLPW
jgi:hypothetical protein